MTPAATKTEKTLASNRKAFHEYFVLDRFEAGLELRGTEVKTVREGSSSLAGGFVRIQDGQAWLFNVHIPPYVFGNRFNHDPDRRRRLLLHRREIDKLEAQTAQKGCTIVPLSLYLKKGLVKIELGLCKGKRQHDKRETIKRATAKREADRAMARHR